NDFLRQLCPTGPWSHLAPVSPFIPTRAGCYRLPNGDPFTPTKLPLPAGTHVEAGCQIALSGDAGVPGSPHLHFEIQALVPINSVNDSARSPTLNCFSDGQPPYADATFQRDSTRVCLPQDPYGWTCPTAKCLSGDPYSDLTGIASRSYWAKQ